MSLVSILIPAFNEEKTICELLARVSRIDLGPGNSFEIIVVDDASTDATASLVEAHLSRGQGKLLRHERNLGKGGAIRSALNEAKGDVVIVQDADLEYDPSDIPSCVLPIIEGTADVVYGSRRLDPGNERHSSWTYFAGGVLVTTVFNVLFGGDLTDEPTCYKAFRRKLFERVGFSSNGFEWEPEITGRLVLAGVKILEVPISYNPRLRDEGKKITWRDGIKAIVMLLRVRLGRH